MTAANECVCRQWIDAGGTGAGARATDRWLLAWSWGTRRCRGFERPILGYRTQLSVLCAKPLRHLRLNPSVVVGHRGLAGAGAGLRAYNLSRARGAIGVYIVYIGRYTVFISHALRYIDCHKPDRTQPGHCTSYRGPRRSAARGRDDGGGLTQQCSSGCKASGH